MAKLRIIFRCKMDLLDRYDHNLTIENVKLIAMLKTNIKDLIFKFFGEICII